MKEYKINYNSFIGGWFIPEKICDDIIKFFKENKKFSVQGTGHNKPVNKKVKDSIDIVIGHNYFNPPFDEYRTHLQNCLMEYVKKYPDASICDYYNINVPYNIQHYKKNGGYKVWHCESNGKSTCSRNLVFMTYLNTVKNAGTEFKYQKLTTECKKGLTLIWPSSFTHTHRGVINKKHEKYIITGWYTYT